MRPEYGECRDCAAWIRCNGAYQDEGCCCLGPSRPIVRDLFGCWSFIPKLAKDAFATEEQFRDLSEAEKRAAEAKVKP